MCMKKKKNDLLVVMNQVVWGNLSYYGDPGRRLKRMNLYFTYESRDILKSFSLVFLTFKTYET